MNALYSKALFSAFPLLYKGRTRPLSASLMSYGFACGDGRYELLERYSTKIEEHLRTLQANGTPRDKLPEAVQVKDLNGTLRMFLSAYDETLETLVKELSFHSESICDTCGKSDASLHTHEGRTRTLCAYHAERQRRAPDR